jgi:hypothetical protein
MEEDIGIVINVKNINAKALQDLVRGFGSLQKSMTATTKSGVQMDRAMEGMMGSMTRSITSVSFALNDLRFQMAAAAKGVKAVTFDAAAAGIKIAADTEEANTRLGFSLSKINKKYEDVAARIDDVSLKTILTRKDITNMVSDLAIQKIDAFDQGLEALSFTAEDGSKKTISALEVLNDAVAFSGKNSKRVLLSVKEAVSEQKIRPGRFLADDLNLSRKELDKWNAAIKSAGSNQDVFNTLLGMMAERVGGTSDAIKGTLNFMLKQFDDFRDKLATEVFGPSVKEVTSFLREVGDAILNLVKSGDLKGIAEAMRVVTAGFMGLARGALLAVKAMTKFVAAFPEVIALFFAAATAVIGFTGALVVLAAMAAPLLALISILTLVAAAASVVSGVGLAIAGSLALVGGVVATVVAGLAGLGSILLLDTFKAKGFMDMWERIKIVMSAVVEGVKNMEDGVTHLSLDTAKALDDRGLLGLVKNLLHWWDGLGVAFKSFQEQWKTFGPQFKQAFQPALEAAIRFAENLGIDTNSGITKGMTEFQAAGVKAANALAGAFIKFLNVLEKIITLMDLVRVGLDIELDKFRTVGKIMDMGKGFMGSPAMAMATSALPGASLTGAFTAKDSDEDKPSFFRRLLTSTGDLRRAQQEKEFEASPAARRRANYFRLLNEGSPGGAGAPLTGSGDVDVQGVLGSLSEVREQQVGVALSRFIDSDQFTNARTGKNSEREAFFKTLVSLLGKEVANALVKNPPKIMVDGRELTGKVTGDVEFDFAAGN